MNGNESHNHRQYISPAEFLKMLDGRISKNTLYGALHSGEVPSVKIGKKFLIPVDALDRMLGIRSDG